MADISVRGLITDGKRLFVVSNQWVPGYLVLPGGSVEVGESLAVALEREFMEELGVKPQIRNLIAVHQITNKDQYSAPNFIFHITNTDDFMNIDLNATSHGEAEIDEFKFTNDLTALLPQELAALLPELHAENFNGPCRMIMSEGIDS